MSNAGVVSEAVVQPPIRGPPVALAAAVEAFFGLLLCLFIGGGAKAVVIDYLSEENLEHASGFLQVFSILLVSSIIYVKRWRPRGNFQDSIWDVLKNTVKIFVPSINLEVLTLLGFHLSQLLWLIYWHDYSLSSENAMECMNPTAVFWGPLFEEVIFRVVLFNIVVQRTGGHVGTSCLITSTLFGAIHLSNVWSNGNDIYSWIQVIAGVFSGICWTMMYASTGSLTNVLLPHIANNIVAVAWLSYHVSKGDIVSCFDRAFSYELLGSMFVQSLIYSIVTFQSWKRLFSIVTSEDKNSFRRLHPIVYDPADLVEKVD